MRQKLLAGNWQMNYPIEMIATLNAHQAAHLLHAYSKDDMFDNWIAYKPRDLKVKIDYPINPAITLVVEASAIDWPEYGVKRWQPNPGESACLGMFLLEVARKYSEIYEHPGEYGVWGHSPEQLYFEVVNITRGGDVVLNIGS